MTELYEEDENEIPRNSAFHPDNIGPVALITLLHIKDYLAILAGTANGKATDFAENLHEQGKFLCPPPLAPLTSTGPIVVDNEDTYGEDSDLNLG